jgi:hypothetical protein
MPASRLLQATGPNPRTVTCRCRIQIRKWREMQPRLLKVFIQAPSPPATAEKFPNLLLRLVPTLTFRWVDNFNSAVLEIANVASRKLSSSHLGQCYNLRIRMANGPAQGTASSPNLGEHSCCIAVKDENASRKVFAKHCFSRGQQAFATLTSAEKLNSAKSFRFGYRGCEELGPRLLRDPGSNLRRRLGSYELRYHVGIDDYHSANGAV